MNKVPRIFPVSLFVLMAISPLATSHASSIDESFAPVYHPRMDVIRAAGRIEIDGELDDEGWVGAAQAKNFAEHQPGDQVKPPVETVALLTYDDDNLYVAFLCYDDPASVRASFCERDRIWSDDYVILLLDTYADGVWAYEISVNPYGIQGDLLWSSCVGEDMGYDLVYTSAGEITEEGYQVEMAIPFASLRFPNQQRQEWRVDFWRNHPRSVRGQYSWAAYDRNEPCWPCQWGTVTGIQGVSPGRGFEFLPTFVAHQSGLLNGNGKFENRDISGDFSLGAAYKLSSCVTAEATYNPDFSQVEADAAQIDVNTTFALFFPERRPFFQEGSELFNTFFDVFYSRSINDPLFAAKVTGRPGRTNVAFLSARDEHTPFILPFEESSQVVTAGASTSNILRVRQALGGQSHVGMIATDRRIDGGGSGSVLGVDGRLRLSQNYHVEWQALATSAVEPDDTNLTVDLGVEDFNGGQHTAAFDGESFWGHGIYASFERDGRHLCMDFDYWEHSPTFRADNGFEPQNNDRLVTVYTGYIFFFDHGLVEWIEPNAFVGRRWNFDDVVKDGWLHLNLSTRLRRAQTYFHAQYQRSIERFQGIHFEDLYRWHVCGSSVPSDLLSWGFSANYGHNIARDDLVMGEETSFLIWGDLRPADRLLMESTFDFAHSDDLETGEELFKGYIARSRLTLQITRELSARLVVQYNDFRQTWEVDPLITYRINPFSIFYVGSTRDYENLDDDEYERRGWSLTERQYFMKLQYLLQL